METLYFIVRQKTTPLYAAVSVKRGKLERLSGNPEIFALLETSGGRLQVKWKDGVNVDDYSFRQFRTEGDLNWEIEQYKEKIKEEHRQGRKQIYN